MKKFLIFLLCSFCLMACKSVPGYTFSVNNEEISVMVDITEPFSLKEKENGFSIETDDKKIQGMFIQTSAFDAYYDTVSKDESVDILYQNASTIIWQIDGESGKEMDCIHRISSSTSILMGSLDDVDSVYKGISFEVK